MKKYHSHNANEALFPFFIVLLLSFPLFIIYEKCYIYVFIISIIISLIIILYSIKSTIESMYDIFFYEDKIEVKFMYIQKTETILYNDLMEYHFLRSKSSHDYIKYKNGKKSFPILNYDNTIEFIKWLKEKNPEIKIEIYPSDCTLEYEYQKEYGFKYRKFHKDTL